MIRKALTACRATDLFIGLDTGRQRQKLSCGGGLQELVHDGHIPGVAGPALEPGCVGLRDRAQRGEIGGTGIVLVQVSSMRSPNHEVAHIEQTLVKYPLKCSR